MVVLKSSQKELFSTEAKLSFHVVGPMSQVAPNTLPAEEMLFYRAYGF